METSIKYSHDPLFERPDEFLPERYLNDDGKTLSKELIEHTIAFSIGKRQCAGEALARVELFLGLVSTVQNFKILPSSDGPVDLTPITHLIILPSQQFVTLEPIISIHFPFLILSLEMGLALLFGVAALFGLLYYIFSYYRHVARYPKGPFPLPLIGNMLTLKSRGLHDNIRDLSLQYGPVFTLFIPVPMVVIADYEGVKEAFIVKGDDFIARPDQVVDKRFLFCENQGVINSNGNSWRENRRQAISILRDFGMGKNLMEEQVKLSITEYLRCLSKIEDKTKVDMRWPIQLMVANIINETLFGYRYDYENCDPLINYVEAFNKLQGYIRSNVDQALAKFDPENEPECFAHAYAKKMGTSPYLTKEQLYATSADFFLAGQETTTTTLRWAMLLMAANQDKQEAAREEILRVVGHSRLPSMADKRDLPYTMATVHEVQRRANILMMNVARKTVVDTEVMGFKIPADTFVDGDIHQIMAHDPIFENPLEFRPERYLNEDGKTLNKDVVERTVPFSRGRRQCAGEKLNSSLVSQRPSRTTV
ncbi:hypothetical protein PMAYCL1PPCAC_17555, partial [Pristionchus mayeri]